MGGLDEQVLMGLLEGLGRERRGEESQVGLKMHKQVRDGVVGVQGEEELGQGGRGELWGGGEEKVWVVEDDEGVCGGSGGSGAGSEATDGGGDCRGSMVECSRGERVQASGARRRSRWGRWWSPS